ncbi:MAG: RNA methyltransferase [Candidatus Hydrogenedentes bacterium]|nr:RNA methyltransferase [Candidatus Hydrogenedentota bacterium]
MLNEYPLIGATTREPHYLKIPHTELPSLPRNPIHVVLDNLRSAFNVGSIFRTADAGAVAHMHLCGMTSYPPNKKLEKTALGAHDYVPWTHHANVREAIDALNADGITCIAIEAIEGATPHIEFPWPRPVAIVFGNEVTGIAPETIDRCAGIVQIPMHGYKNTINVATAYGVIQYEILRQWNTVLANSCGASSSDLG